MRAAAVLPVLAEQCGSAARPLSANDAQRGGETDMFCRVSALHRVEEDPIDEVLAGL